MKAKWPVRHICWDSAAGDAMRGRLQIGVGPGVNCAPESLAKAFLT